MTSQDPGAGWGRESSHSRTSREWVGGSLSAPFFIHDHAEPYRPCIVIWFIRYQRFTGATRRAALEYCRRLGVTFSGLSSS